MHILILCTANSARSQMAEGILRRLAGERVQAFSATTIPARKAPNTIETPNRYAEPTAIALTRGFARRASQLLQGIKPGCLTGDGAPASRA